MRPSREIKKNRAFKNSLRGGIIIIIILSMLISWISVTVIRFMEDSKRTEGTEEDLLEESTSDTVFIERIREIKKTDTVYRYIKPEIPSKPKGGKTEDPVSPGVDTLSR